MPKYFTTGRYREGLRISFLAHPAAWPCPKSDRPRCASAAHFPLPSASIAGPGRLLTPCTSSSTARTSVPIFRPAGSVRRSVSPVPPASESQQSAPPRTASSSRQILPFLGLDFAGNEPSFWIKKARSHQVTVLGRRDFRAVPILESPNRSTPDHNP